MSILAFLGKETNKAVVRRKLTLLPTAVVGEEHVESSGQCLSAPPLASLSVLLARCGSSVSIQLLSCHIKMIKMLLLAASWSLVELPPFYLLPDGYQFWSVMLLKSFPWHFIDWAGLCPYENFSPPAEKQHFSTSQQAVILLSLQCCASTLKLSDTQWGHSCLAGTSRNS